MDRVPPLVLAFALAAACGPQAAAPEGAQGAGPADAAGRHAAGRHDAGRHDAGRLAPGESWRWAAAGAFVAEFLARHPDRYGVEQPLSVWLADPGPTDGEVLTVPEAVLARWRDAGLPVGGESPPHGVIVHVPSDPAADGGALEVYGSYAPHSWGGSMDRATLVRESWGFVVTDFASLGQACF